MVRGTSITVASSTGNRVIIYKRPFGGSTFDGGLEMASFGICEIKIYNGAGALITPTSVAVSSLEEWFTVEAMNDTDTTNCFSHSYYSSFGPQFVNITLPSSVASVTRIVLDSNLAHPVAAEVVVVIGTKIFYTTLESARTQVPVITIPVRLNNVYEDGLLVKSAVNGRLYRIEGGMRRHVPYSIWEKSLNPRYITVYDRKVLSLPLGSSINETIVSTDNFVYVSYPSMKLQEIQVVYTNGTTATFTVPDISCETGGRERLITDGQFVNSVPIEAVPVHLRLQATASVLVRHIKIFADSQYVRFESYDYPIIGPLEVKVRINGVVYEFKAPFFDWGFGNSITINVDPITTVPATSGVAARLYPHTFSATFPSATAVHLTGVRNDQCPQACDQRVGCVAYALQAGSLTDCTLYLGSLSNPVASTTTKTYVAGSSVLTAPQNSADLLTKQLYRGSSKLPSPPANAPTYTYLEDFDLIFDHCTYTASCRALTHNPSYTLSYYLNSTYTDQVFSHNVSLLVPASNCATPSALYKTMGGKCYLTLQSTSAPHSVPVFIRTYSVKGVEGRLEGSRIGKMVRFLGYDRAILRLDGEDLFEIDAGSCSTCENQLQFESVKQPGKYICANGLTLSLSHKGPGLNCEWDADATHQGFSVLKPFGDVNEPIIDYDVSGKLVLTQQKSLYRYISLYTFPRPPPERAYTPGNLTDFVGGQVIKTFEGPISLCSEVCDKTVGCVGYQIYANQQGCVLKSSLGVPMPGSSTANLTVSVVPMVENLTEELPWQLQMALLGGKPRTFATGAGIHIHIIDSGITPYRGEKGFYDDLLIPSNASWTDDASHADVIAKILKRGIVPGATIHNIKIFDQNKQANSTSFVRAVLDVMQRATDNFKSPRAIRPTIISVSAVFPQNFPVDCIMESAYKMGIFLVVAAGNEEGVAYNDWATMSPAASRHAIVVGSYDSEYKIKLSKHGRFVDIYAAGCDFEDDFHPGAKLCGTSLAAPQVAGVLAKFLEENPEFQTLPPVYAYRAIKSGAIKGLLKNTTSTTQNLVLSGLSTTLPTRYGDWLDKNTATTTHDSYALRSCTLEEAILKSTVEVVLGKLVATSVSPSSGTEPGDPEESITAVPNDF